MICVTQGAAVFGFDPRGSVSIDILLVYVKRCPLSTSSISPPSSSHHVPQRSHRTYQNPGGGDRQAFLWGQLRNRRCAAWDAFRRAVWGKGLEAFQRSQPVQRDTSDQVKGVALSDNHLVATIPTIPDGDKKARNRQILVRSEYDEAARAAVLLSGELDRDVFVVTGQPGIGPPSSLPTARRN